MDFAYNKGQITDLTDHQKCFVVYLSTLDYGPFFEQIDGFCYYINSNRLLDLNISVHPVNTIKGGRHLLHVPVALSTLIVFLDCSH